MATVQCMYVCRCTSTTYQCTIHRQNMIPYQLEEMFTICLFYRFSCSTFVFSRNWFRNCFKNRTNTYVRKHLLCLRVTCVRCVNFSHVALRYVEKPFFSFCRLKIIRTRFKKAIITKLNVSRSTYNKLARVYVYFSKRVYLIPTTEKIATDRPNYCAPVRIAINYVTCSSKFDKMLVHYKV